MFIKIYKNNLIQNNYYIKIEFNHYITGKDTFSTTSKQTVGKVNVNNNIIDLKDIKLEINENQGLEEFNIYIKILQIREGSDSGTILVNYENNTTPRNFVENKTIKKNSDNFIYNFDNILDNNIVLLEYSKKKDIISAIRFNLPAVTQSHCENICKSDLYQGKVKGKEGIRFYCDGMQRKLDFYRKNKARDAFEENDALINTSQKVIPGGYSKPENGGYSIGTNDGEYPKLDDIKYFVVNKSKTNCNYYPPANITGGEIKDFETSEINTSKDSAYNKYLNNFCSNIYFKSNGENYYVKPFTHNYDQIYNKSSKGSDTI